MKNISYLFLLLCSYMIFSCSDIQEKGKQYPNIVIIYADDMGYGDLKAQNSASKIPTPHLDQLVREGMMFTNAHSSSGICTPSRYSLLTGTYHWRKFHGIVNSWDKPVIDSTEFTIPEMLKQSNYKTACIGKWHLGWDLESIRNKAVNAVPLNSARTPWIKEVFTSEAFDWSKPIANGPTAHGFDYYYGDDVPNFPPYCWFENDRIVEAPTELLEITEKTLEGEWEARPGPSMKSWDFYSVMPTITEKAIQWIAQQKKEEPFFLYFAMASPHAPIVPTKEWQGKSGAGAYGDYMMQSDWSVGEILKALKDSGFEDKTIVIFSSDNGPEHYAYDRVRNFNHRSMGELRGVKRDVWEGGHRVPFIVKWPKVVKPGTVSNDLISQIDLFSTLAAITGSKLSAGTAGDSFDQTDLLKGLSKSSRSSMVHNTFSEKHALQKDNWVYINSNNGGHSRVPDWYESTYEFVNDTINTSALFNLKNDIRQNKNLINQYPEKAKEL